MSFSKDLKALKRQRRDEIRTLKHAYVRTKRDLKRAASPSRLVRKHLPVGLGAAALVGFLLAPRPSPRYVQPPHAAKNDAPKEPEKSTGKLSWITSLLKTALPKFASFIPGVEPAPVTAAPPPPPKTGHPLLGVALKAALPMLTLFLKKIDVQKVVDQVLKQVMPKDKHDDHPDDNDPHTDDASHHDPDNGPNFTVANTGTVQTD